MAADKSQTDLSSIGFPRLGNLHPLGTTIDFVSNQMEIDRSNDAHSSSSLCSMQSSDWSRLINMTAVITGINEDGSLSTTSSVASGTNVVLMETSAQSLKTAINKVRAMVICCMFISQLTELTEVYVSISSDGCSSHGEQQILHPRDDRLPDVPVGWCPSTSGPQKHGRDGTSFIFQPCDLSVFSSTFLRLFRSEPTRTGPVARRSWA